MKTVDQVKQAIDYKSQTAYPTYRMETIDQVKQAIDYKFQTAYPSYRMKTIDSYAIIKMYGHK